MSSEHSPSFYIKYFLYWQSDIRKDAYIEMIREIQLHRPTMLQFKTEKHRIELAARIGASMPNTGFKVFQSVAIKQFYSLDHVGHGLHC